MDTTLTRRATVLSTPIGHIVLTPTHVDAGCVTDMMSAAGTTSLDFGWSNREGFWGEELFAPGALVAEVLAANGWAVTQGESDCGLLGSSLELTDDDLACFARDFDRNFGGAL